VKAYVPNSFYLRLTRKINERRVVELATPSCSGPANGGAPTGNPAAAHHEGEEMKTARELADEIRRIFAYSSFEEDAVANMFFMLDDEFPVGSKFQGVCRTCGMDLTKVATLDCGQHGCAAYAENMIYRTDYRRHE
jgi:hypothetical protein